MNERQAKIELLLPPLLRGKTASGSGRAANFLQSALRRHRHVHGAENRFGISPLDEAEFPPDVIGCRKLFWRAAEHRKDARSLPPFRRQTGIPDTLSWELIMIVGKRLKNPADSRRELESRYVPWVAA